jgi:hypothetical protein
MLHTLSAVLIGMFIGVAPPADDPEGMLLTRCSAKCSVEGCPEGTHACCYWTLAGDCAKCRCVQNGKLPEPGVACSSGGGTGCSMAETAMPPPDDGTATAPDDGTIIEVATVDSVDVGLYPPWSSATTNTTTAYEVILTSDSVVAVGAVDLLIEWDVSEAGVPAGRVASKAIPTARPTLELIEVTPLGTWFVADFLPDPDGINDDITDGQAIYTLLAPVGWPVGQPVATPNGTPVLRLKFKVRATGSVDIVPAAGAYGETRVLEYGVPNSDITGDNEAVSTAYICCGC